MEKVLPYTHTWQLPERVARTKFYSVLFDITRLTIMWALASYVFLKKKLLPAWQPQRCITIKKRGKEMVVPRINTWWVDGVSQRCRGIREGSGRWRALDIIVRHHDLPVASFINVVDNFWLNIRNARAVRNRHRIITDELVHAMYQSYVRYNAVRVVSIAYGSFEAVLAAAKTFITNSIPVSVLYCDIDREAVAHAQMRVQEECMQEHIITKCLVYLKTANLQATLKQSAPTIIEMGGLFDHLTDAQVTAISREAHAALPDGGYFMSAHAHHNAERFFMEQVLEWGMHYRSADELQHLVTNAAPWKVHSLITEPEGIHSIITTVKKKNIEHY